MKVFLRLQLINFRNWTDPCIFPCLRKIVLPDTVVDNSCEGVSNGFSHHFKEFDRDTAGASRCIRSLPWSNSQSLKLAGLSSGRDSISSSRQEGKSLLTGKVLLAVQAKNEFNLSGSCCKGCWLGFSMGWMIHHSSFGL